jgi:hypothetical protein
MFKNTMDRKRMLCHCQLPLRSTSGDAVRQLRDQAGPARAKSQT